MPSSEKWGQFLSGPCRTEDERSLLTFRTNKNVNVCETKTQESCFQLFFKGAMNTQQRTLKNVGKHTQENGELWTREQGNLLLLYTFQYTLEFKI